MSGPRTFATLKPKLLARKGAARPAMRRQDGSKLAGSLIKATHASAPSTGPGEAPHEDLGWNDWGHEAEAAEVQLPQVLRQLRDLAERISRFAGPAVRIPNSERRRAAFTLRLDAERHFRLKMAGLILDRSAQVIVTEALDKYLSEVPGISSPDGTPGGQC